MYNRPLGVHGTLNFNDMSFALGVSDTYSRPFYFLWNFLFVDRRSDHFFCWEVCEGLTVVILVVGVGCVKVVAVIPFLVGFVSWWNVGWKIKDQYETAGGTTTVHESRTAGEPGTRSIEQPILSLNPRNRVPG